MKEISGPLTHNELRYESWSTSLAPYHIPVENLFSILTHLTLDMRCFRGLNPMVKTRLVLEFFNMVSLFIHYFLSFACNFCRRKKYMLSYQICLSWFLNFSWPFKPYTQQAKSCYEILWPPDPPWPPLTLTLTPRRAREARTRGKSWTSCLTRSWTRSTWAGPTTSQNGESTGLHSQSLCLSFLRFSYSLQFRA